MIRAILILLITSTTTFAQEWVTHQLDTDISIDFPTDPIIVDTATAFHLAYVDSAGARFLTTEEAFENYKYDKKITNIEELNAFYDYMVNMVTSQNGAAVLLTSHSDYKNDLLV